MVYFLGVTFCLSVGYGLHFGMQLNEFLKVYCHEHE